MGHKYTTKFFLPCAICIIIAFISTDHILAAEQSSLSLDIQGVVEQRCSVSGLVDSTIAIQLVKTNTIEFVINCNSPFRYSVISANGGLKYQGSESTNNTAGLFPRLIPYSTSITIPLEQGNKSQISDHCDSHALQQNNSGCEFSDSGSSIAINKKASLSIKPELSASNVFLAGSYSDTLVIEMTVN